MVEWIISDQDIESTEKLLLPDGASFHDDARAVIRCWHSTDVAACPGSGKTTVLLAKIKLLADRMPFEKGSGICVLSHTNVAVDEIKKRLSGYADRLLGFPNYIGTIQSFVDRFVTKPYAIQKYGRSIRPVEDRIYFEHLKQLVYSGRYRALWYSINSKFSTAPSGLYSDEVDFLSKIYFAESGSLMIPQQKFPLAGADKPSTTQYHEAVKELLFTEGLIRYKDAYVFAKKAIDHLSEDYTDLFSQRFRYVFVDEYQDCYPDQREALRKLFDRDKCCVMHIGDSDQAIYNSDVDDITDWNPSEGFLPIASSCRYSQEIADVLQPLRINKEAIVSAHCESGFKPVIIVYDLKTITDVVGQFIVQLEQKGLHNSDGIYKAIGNVGKESGTGIKIGSYWDNYESKRNSRSDFRYWAAIDDICCSLEKGKLYCAEQSSRKLIVKILHYAGITNADTGKEFTIISIREALKEEYSDIYFSYILGLTELPTINRETVKTAFGVMIRALLTAMDKDPRVVSASLPDHFTETPITDRVSDNEKNAMVDPLRGRRIVFDTIHGVKGETHDATLYLETERNRGTDLSRILYCYGAGRKGQSTLYDYSRKLAYVGFSRPRKLLCIAMQESTYNKSKKVFQNKKWEIVDIRKKTEE